MVDLRVVEAVEGVLVEVLGIEADEVVPCADLRADLGAGPADLLRVLHLLNLGPERPMVELDRTGDVAPLTVAELVARVQDVTAPSSDDGWRIADRQSTRWPHEHLSA